MKKQVFRVNSDGFNGAWYPAPVKSSRGLIIMLGDSSEDQIKRITVTIIIRWRGLVKRSLI